MLDVTIVTTENELMQVHQLNRLNLRSNVDAAIQKQEGFVTWLYSVELLIKMHQLVCRVRGCAMKDELLRTPSTRRSQNGTYAHSGE